jgi:hypothetical protein
VRVSRRAALPAAPRILHGRNPLHLCDANGIVETVTLGDLIPKAFQLG